jgi:hypothetical protein
MIAADDAPLAIVVAVRAGEPPRQPVPYAASMSNSFRGTGRPRRAPPLERIGVLG